MKCKYANEIKKRAANFFKEMKKIGLKCELTSVEGEYFIRVKITDAGEVIGFADIYHKPTKRTFSIMPNGKMTETDKLRVVACFTKQKPCLPVIQPPLQTYINEGLEIDVDGSYMQGRASYAAIVRLNGQEIKRLYGEADASSNQINGELQAVIEAVKWCEQNNHKQVRIYHDLIHSERFATGKFSTCTEFAKAYKSYVNVSPVKIDWVKVPAHTGFHWNEEADKLAKSVLI